MATRAAGRARMTASRFGWDTSIVNALLIPSKISTPPKARYSEVTTDSSSSGGISLSARNRETCGVRPTHDATTGMPEMVGRTLRINARAIPCASCPAEIVARLHDDDTIHAICDAVVRVACGDHVDEARRQGIGQREHLSVGVAVAEVRRIAPCVTSSAGLRRSRTDWLVRARSERE